MTAFYLSGEITAFYLSGEITEFYLSSGDNCVLLVKGR